MGGSRWFKQPTRSPVITGLAMHVPSLNAQGFIPYPRRKMPGMMVKTALVCDVYRRLHRKRWNTSDRLFECGPVKVASEGLYRKPLQTM